LSILDIPAGTTYSVREADYSGEGYSVYPASGVVTGEMTTANAVATFTNIRNYGKLNIRKVLGGNGGEEDREFEFTVRLTRRDNVDPAGTYPSTMGNIRFVGSGNGVAEAKVSIPGNSSITISDILEGTEYSVTEADYTEEGYITEMTGANGTITTGTSRVTATNTRNVGELTITKKVVALGGLEIPTTQYVFRVTLVKDGVPFSGILPTTNGDLEFIRGNATVKLAHDESITIYDILEGTTYVVTETGSFGAEVSSTGSAGIITTANARADFTNTIRQYRTSITVRKAWNDRDDKDHKRPVEIEVEIYNQFETLFNVKLNEANGWTATFDNLPRFTDSGEVYVYSVREINVPEGYTVHYSATENVITITNSHEPEVFKKTTVTINEYDVPLGAGLNMNEGDCID
ncbi:MAG: Cna B-type domain-containing protein, partial [Clostridia bacterium]|nr:Cna B-type domain-containing protein [Clostridia bacterium]